MLQNSIHPQDFFILVVDDVALNLKVLRAILEPIGYQLSFATSGKQALDRIASAKPDIILLDLMMPDIDGLEVCRRLKNDLQMATIPIIFLTASQEKEHLLQAFELGAVDYVTKPFN
ncbi:MAG: response regulator, partial [Sphaerospermopsis kisseleviana]